MIQPSILFKITKEDEPVILRMTEKHSDFLTVNRRANISI